MNCIYLVYSHAYYYSDINIILIHIVQLVLDIIIIAFEQREVLMFIFRFKTGSPKYVAFETIQVHYL